MAVFISKIRAMKKVEVKDRSLISLSWPLILTFAIGMLQPLMDSWFLSRTSETAAAGVGAMMPVLAALFTALNALAQSGASIASQFIGANQKSHARSTQSMVLVGSLVLGFALTLIIWPILVAFPSGWGWKRLPPSLPSSSFLWWLPVLPSGLRSRR